MRVWAIEIKLMIILSNRICQTAADRLLVFFSESANSNNLISQLEPGLCFKPLYTDLVGRDKQMMV
jgi:hypothetical protein